MSRGAIVINTVAGSSGVGDGLPATHAILREPYGIDAWYNESSGGVALAIAETDGNRVRFIDEQGTIRTLAGTGETYTSYYIDNNIATEIAIEQPRSVSILFNRSSQNLSFAIRTSYGIRYVSEAGSLASVSTCSYSSGYSFELDATVTLDNHSATLLSTVGYGNTICRSDGGPWGYYWASSVVAGTQQGGHGGDGGLATDATFSNIVSLQIVQIPGRTRFQIYIADNNGAQIRRVNEAGYVSTLLSTGGAIADMKVLINQTSQRPTIFLIHSFGRTISKTDEDGVQTTLFDLSAGDNLIGTPRRMAVIFNSAEKEYQIFITDESRVYKLSKSGVEVVAGIRISRVLDEGFPATLGALSSPTSVAVLGDCVYIADTNHRRVQRVDANGIMSTIFGVSGANASLENGGGDLSSSQSIPSGVTAVESGNSSSHIVFIADSGNHCIRRLEGSGVHEMFAGTGVPDFNGDERPARTATLFGPRSVAAVHTHTGLLVFISDPGNSRIRRVNENGVITTVAGNGDAGSYGDGGDATLAALDGPAGL
ncbi:MAG: hypothetical protein EOO65_01980, partial [Methanosarcinales archaeon]